VSSNVLNALREPDLITWADGPRRGPCRAVGRRPPAPRAGDDPADLRAVACGGAHPRRTRLADRVLASTTTRGESDPNQDMNQPPRDPRRPQCPISV
jgi:hypothetical protein